MIDRAVNSYAREGWARDGNLVRRGPPNEPRPGSSNGKIGKTQITGGKRVLKDFRFLISTLRQLIAKGGTANTKELQKACKSVRTAVTAKGGKF